MRAHTLSRIKQLLLCQFEETSFSYGQGASEAAAGATPKEIDSDVLYREGRTLSGDVTYTPRLIAVDLSGSLNTLRSDGVLYDVEVEQSGITWGGDVTMHKASPPVRNQFLSDLDMSEEGALQNPHIESPDKDLEDASMSSSQSLPSIKDRIYHLDDSVSVWSDFLYGHLHPKSLNIVREFAHQSDTEMFELFPQGKDLFKKRTVSEELEDKLHFFAEECDHLQGFQVLTNFDDGFSGMSSGLVELLDDEYHGKGILTWGVIPAVPSVKSTLMDNYRVINSALAFEQLSQYSSFFVPLSLNSSLWRKQGPALTSPYLSYNPNLNYHTSAILASCIDTATLPFRLDKEALTIPEICAMLSVGERKIGTLCSSFPFPLQESMSLVKRLPAFQDTSFLKPLAAEVDKFNSMSPFSQFVVCRGIPNIGLKNRVPQPQNPFDLCKSVDEMMKMLVSSLYPRTVSSLLTVNQAAPTGTPYPHLFSPLVSPTGLVGNKPRSADEVVKSIPLVTSLQSSPATKNLLKKLTSEAKKLDLRKHHGYFESNMEEDEYHEILNNLDSLCQKYETGASSMDDSDDD
ncbi:hypothetical protein BSL78_13143 [Apostichopus japonicus]|uniref:DML1/Misato tubulin domain-containing protein n=1 Tax=Stichopus japonicus TaxID=307972 RepID=A0A2G8KPR1_STIJA|nr:hypothetical protein BSL78_13143 [Apostichopus japonicus]